MKKILSTIAATGLIVGGLATSATAAGTTNHEVRKSDFIAALSDTRATGYYGFGPKGLVIRTDTNVSTDKVAEYFKPATSAFPITASQDWVGSAVEPGKQIVFDADGVSGNGNDYNVLVGEPVYGQNWWLTNGSSATAKAADPSGAENGGNGSDYFGTLADWHAALPNARVVAVGFSLGSGVKGDGTLKSQTYGDDSYTFVDTAAPTAPVVTPAMPVVDATGTFTTAKRKHGRSFRFMTADQPVNTKPGKSVVWKVTVANPGPSFGNGTVRYRSVMAAGAKSHFVYNVPRPGHRKIVRLFKDGVKVGTYRVK